MIKFSIDLDGIAELIGTGYGITNAGDDDEYLGNLLDNAHKVASDEFNTEITAVALASDSFKHMFEWGTLGINTGRSTRRPNPNSEAARLWKNTFVGAGKERMIGFDFKPSVATVPMPTVRRSGISSNVLQMLNRKHIFWNKAAVMESGQSVTIKPKNGKYLFIPFNQNPPENASASNKKRGYMMYAGSVNTTPGQATAGTFTTYWERFWAGRGSEIMEATTQNAFALDAEKELATAGGRGVMVPPTPNNFSAKVRATERKSTANIKRRGRARGEQ